MRLAKILMKGLLDYKSNPVLLIPPLLTTIASFILFDYFMAQIMSSIRDASSPNVMVGLAWSLMGFGFVLVVFGLLSLVGQVSMTGKVILTGKARLSDWWEGLKRYFWRIFGISAIFVGVFMGSSIIAGLALGYAIILPAIMSNPSSFPNRLSPLEPFRLGFIVFGAFGTLIFEIWLAPAILDNKGVGASITSGLSAVKNSGMIFTAFVVLFLLADPSGISSFVLPRIPARLIGAVFSPLWFLIVFRIYVESGLSKLIGSSSAEHVD